MSWAFVEFSGGAFEAFVFAEAAAAVGLAVEVLLPGEIVRAPVKGTEVAVEEGDVELPGDAFGDAADDVVVLVGAAEEGSGEGIEAAFAGAAGSVGESEGVAVFAAFGLVRIVGLLDEEVEAVGFVDFGVERVGFEEDAEGLDAFAEFKERMDVGVVEEAAGLDAFGAE